MGSLILKCPNTGKVLTLKVADNVDVSDKKFQCPSCNQKHYFRDCQKAEKRPLPSREETEFANEKTQLPSGSDKTQLPNINQKAGTLVDSNGRQYQLKEGINTIGRDASTPKATVRIDTDDRTMSRNHAIIEVVRSGLQLVHIIKNSENKNPSYVNNALIGSRDQLVLNDGDKLKFGETILNFKI